MNIVDKFKSRLNPDKEYLSYFMIPAIFIVVEILMELGIISLYWKTILILCGINAVVACSLNLINGITGQSCLGQAGFMSIGAYVSAMMMRYFFKPMMTSTVSSYFWFTIALIIGGIAAGFVGLLIGLPSLRLKGDYLAIITLGFGEMIRVMWRVVPPAGKAIGLSLIPKLSNFPYVYITLILVLFVLRNYTNSRYGRGSIAVRENELAGDTMGINTTAAKIRAFVLAAMIAGIGGGLFASLNTFINPESFNQAKSTDYVLYLYAGGVGSFSSALMGAFIFTIMPEALRFMKAWRLVCYPLVLVLIMIKRPKGLFGKHEFGFMRYGIKENEFEKAENAGVLSVAGKKLKELIMNNKKKSTGKEVK